MGSRWSCLEMSPLIMYSIGDSRNWNTRFKSKASPTSSAKSSSLRLMMKLEGVNRS